MISIKTKKYVSYYAVGLIPLLLGVVLFLLYKNFVNALAITVLAAIILPFFIAYAFRHPLLDVLEEKGFLILELGSHGVIQPHVAQLKTPDIAFSYYGKKLKQMVTRHASFFLMPVKKDATIEDEKDEIVIRMPKSEHTRFTYNAFGKICFLYNPQTNTLIPKDFLAEKEKSLFVEHNALFIVRKIDEISENVKSNADLMIAMLGRARFALPNWAWYVIVGFVLLILGYLAYPYVANALGFGANSVAQVTTSAIDVVTPAR